MKRNLFFVIAFSLLFLSCGPKPDIVICVGCPDGPDTTLWRFSVSNYGNEDVEISVVPQYIYEDSNTVQSLDSYAVTYMVESKDGILFDVNTYVEYDSVQSFLISVVDSKNATSKLYSGWEQWLYSNDKPAELYGIARYKNGLLMTSVNGNEVLPHTADAMVTICVTINEKGEVSFSLKTVSD